MKRPPIGVVGLVAGLVGLAAVAACGRGDTQQQVKVATAPGGSKDPSKWPADDRSICDWRNKPDLEISETTGPGSLKPNVRRVYKSLGEGDTRHKTLVCREIDTNLDGIKDVVRTFNQKGEALHEESDRNFDGRMDVWIDFVNGRMAQEAIDTNLDGKPDVWKFYVDGQLQRIRRDGNFDGKPDVWEIYAKGRLERIGIDETYDGHVDRWERDEQLKYEAENAERKARDKMDAGASPSTDTADGGAAPSTASGTGGADAGAKPTAKAAAPKGTLPKN